MNLNFIFGFFVIIGSGATAMVALRPMLESGGYSQTQIMICLIVLMMVVISIPPLLLRMDNGSSENKLESIGKPFTLFGFLFSRAFLNPIGIITLLLIVIVNILVWR